MTNVTGSSKDVSRQDALRILGGFAMWSSPDEPHAELRAAARAVLHDRLALIRQLEEMRVAAATAAFERAENEPPAGCAQCSNVAPIAKLTVRDGLAVRAGLYAPGLPDGEHDVYPAASSQPPSALRPGLERAIDIVSAIEAPSDYYEPFKSRLIDALQDAVYSSETKEVNQAGQSSSGDCMQAPTPRGSLPNSLGTQIPGCIHDSAPTTLCGVCYPSEGEE